MMHSMQGVSYSHFRAAPPAAAAVAAAPLAGIGSRRVALFVEPSPFSHVSGMKNRFECLIKHLREAGDEVRLVRCLMPPALKPDSHYASEHALHTSHVKVRLPISC